MFWDPRLFFSWQEKCPHINQDTTNGILTHTTAVHTFNMHVVYAILVNDKGKTLQVLLASPVHARQNQFYKAVKSWNVICTLCHWE
jgi:hypothetical protein